MKIKTTVLVIVALQFAAGFSSAQLAIDEAAVDAIFSAYDRTDGPGCAVGILSEGELVYARGYGMANLEHDIPLTSTSVLRIGSTSKQFTAACAVLAEQQGALSLDADVHEYLPELPNYGSPITVRHLLNHTSGIRDYLGLMTLAGHGDDDFYTDEDAFAMIARQEGLNFPPGSRHLYSNSGYFLISVIIQRTTGKTLAEFGEEFIFRPLGMTNTHFHDDSQRVVKQRADGHTAGEDGSWRISNTTLEMCGDGGVFTSVEDMMLWDSNFYEPRVGGPELIADLKTRGRLNDGTELNYALGLTMNDYRGLRRVSHGGAFVGFRADAIRFPDQQLSVIVFANIDRIRPTRLALQVADLVLKDAFDAASQTTPASSPKQSAPSPSYEFVELAAEQLEGFASRYIDQASGTLVTITSDGSTLNMSIDAESVLFRPTSELEFGSTSTTETLRFEPAQLAGFWNAVAVTPTNTLVLGPYLPWDDSMMSLEDYVGDYYSAELDTTWTFSIEGGQLTFSSPLARSASLRPLALDLFESPAGIISFTRDDFQSVHSYQLNAGRVLGLKFERRE